MNIFKTAEERYAAFFLRKVRKAFKQIAKGRKIGSIYNYNDIGGIRGAVEIHSNGKSGRPYVQVVCYNSWVPLHMVYEALVKEGYVFDPPSGEHQTPVDYAAGRNDMFILEINLPVA